MRLVTRPVRYIARRVDRIQRTWSVSGEIVFMSVPKTASGSIVEACKPLGVTIIDHNLRNPDYVSLADYRAKSTAQLYAFAFVRNPWDRLVSAFFHLTEGGSNPGDAADRARYLGEFDGDFRAFVQRTFSDDQILQQIHFRPQYLWITDSSGMLVADFVGRFENLHEDFGRVCEVTGLRPRPLPHDKRSDHQHYQSYYDDSTRRIVAKAYERDIRMFGYSF